MTIVVTSLQGAGVWTIPADWNDADNTIELIAPGGGGYPGAASVSSGGGGGGSYTKMTNVPIRAHYLAGNITGLDYCTTDTYSPVYYSSVFLQGIQYYSGGTPVTGWLFYGQGVSSNANGAIGGTGGNTSLSQQIAGYNYWSGGYSGGNGGNGRVSTAGVGGGGGGAAGPGGNGGNGGSSTTTAPTAGRGGGGGGGGAAGSSTSAVGGAGGSGGRGGNGGTAASGSPGSISAYGGGGGGGGGDGSSARKGGDGGAYGGGGGGAGSTSGSLNGASSPGIILITYTAYIPPAVSNTMFLMF